MKRIWLIAKRELAATIRSPLGFVVAALILTIAGLLFNTRALGSEPKLSAEVLAQFFFDLSGLIMIASVPISMRLLAEERQNGTLALLFTSGLSDAKIVLGKFTGAMVFLAALTLATIYMPLLILVHGHVSWGHLLAGYFGLLLLGAASLSVGIFGSALARNQIMAVFITAFLLAALVLFWMVAKVSEPPLADIFMYIALHNVHFFPFKEGVIHLRDVVYYISVSGFFLFCATRILESRRWR